MARTKRVSESLWPDGIPLVGDREPWPSSRANGRKRLIRLGFGPYASALLTLSVQLAEGSRRVAVTVLTEKRHSGRAVNPRLQYPEVAASGHRPSRRLEPRSAISGGAPP